MPSIIANIKVKEDKVDEAKAFFSKLSKETVEKEEGTLVYVAHQRKDDPTMFVFYEKYADDAAFAAHGEGLKAHGSSFAAVMAGPPEIIFIEEV